MKKILTLLLIGLVLFANAQTGDDPLPVELTSFTASLTENNAVLLEWSTATEEINKGFEIQRSTDGETFKEIGFVDGHGTTLEPKQYRFQDIYLGRSTQYYYRLKQIDTDGKFEYSDVRQITVKVQNNDFTLLSNTVKEQLNIDGSGKYIITNQIGQVLREGLFDGATVVNIGSIQSGLYNLTLINNSNFKTVRFFKLE